MRIGINIDAQFINMTGIQHSVDSLINGLYHLETPHAISAFTSYLPSNDAIEEAAEKNPGTFEWRNLPQAHLDIWNDPRTFIPQRIQKNHVWLSAKLRTHEMRLLSRMPGSPEKRAMEYDVFHNPDPLDMRFAAYRPRHEVATIYDLATRVCPWAYPKWGIALWERYWKWAKERCDVMIAISESTKRDAVDDLKIDEDRIFVTPLAPRVSAQPMADGPIRQGMLKKLKLDGHPFVLYAGTLEPRKNLDGLIRAFARLVKDDPSIDHKLVLAGGNWERLDLELRILACEVGIGGRVLTTGYVTNDELNALMSACDAFVYVSQYEGFGMPPLEAMVCGAPVVVSNTSSLPEVVGDAGLLVPPKDEEAIADAIRILLTDSDENRRRRALSLERAATFSWERTARLTLKAYEAAAAS